MSDRITTDKRREAARINGAKSRGPKTPEGKARSAQNSIKHGAYARCAYLLSNEDAALFDEFRESFVEKFQPADPVETSLVDEMAFARWRMRRFWFVQDVTIDLEMIRQEDTIHEQFDPICEPGRIALAVTSLVDDSKSLEFLYRVESRCNRQFHRALKDLLHLQSLRQPPAAASKTPEIKNSQTNPSQPQPSPDQHPAPAPMAHFRAAAALIAALFALAFFSARSWSAHGGSGAPGVVAAFVLATAAQANRTSLLTNGSAFPTTASTSSSPQLRQSPRPTHGPLRHDTSSVYSACSTALHCRPQIRA